MGNLYKKRFTFLTLLEYEKSFCLKIKYITKDHSCLIIKQIPHMYVKVDRLIFEDHGITTS
ncbi:hypothetical protein M153_18240002079 [Pseudoloma neurophilia]|uniref:Uncharacterized protein n=1 Tax=Pseudoloma neurophilia TaxID=146866 RepID=A0A0R0LUC2_9MICR|nr:hypothetical protein M153_18240002079 [Pseudoloma neurophilia]